MIDQVNLKPCTNLGAIAARRGEGVVHVPDGHDRERHASVALAHLHLGAAAGAVLARSSLRGAAAVVLAIN